MVVIESLCDVNRKFIDSFNIPAAQFDLIGLDNCTQDGTLGLFIDCLAGSGGEPTTRNLCCLADSIALVTKLWRAMYVVVGWFTSMPSTSHFLRYFLSCPGGSEQVDCLISSSSSLPTRSCVLFVLCLLIVFGEGIR